MMSLTALFLQKAAARASWATSCRVARPTPPKQTPGGAGQTIQDDEGDVQDDLFTSEPLSNDESNQQLPELSPLKDLHKAPENNLHLNILKIL